MFLAFSTRSKTGMQDQVGRGEDAGSGPEVGRAWWAEGGTGCGFGSGLVLSPGEESIPRDIARRGLPAPISSSLPCGGVAGD